VEARDGQTDRRTDRQTDGQHRYIMGSPSRKDGPIITQSSSKQSVLSTANYTALKAPNAAAGRGPGVPTVSYFGLALPFVSRFKFD